jgi:uncharacterized protein (DUF433 family)
MMTGVNEPSWKGMNTSPRFPEFLDRPLYTLVEVSKYTRLPTSTVQSWLGTRGLIVPAKRAPSTLSFLNLVEVFVLAAIRRRHGVPMQRTRQAVRYVSQQLKVDRPLVHQQFQTDGVDLFVERLGTIVNASRSGQLTIKEAMQHRLSRIEWNEGLAARIFPFTRDDSTDGPRAIVIAPEFGFGQPVIVGTGARVSVIRERFRAGEGSKDLAKDYGVTCEQIEEALRMDAA